MKILPIIAWVIAIVALATSLVFVDERGRKIEELTKEVKRLEAIKIPFFMLKCNKGVLLPAGSPASAANGAITTKVPDNYFCVDDKGVQKNYVILERGNDKILQYLN